MKDYPKISIIIPVYNNEKYIINAVNSAICQGYEGAVEIIVIDDGSTDNTLKKINKRFSESEQVKIFSKENGGVSSARNYGLDKASGEYITFLDSDDELVFSTALSDLYSEIECGDMVLASYNKIWIKKYTEQFKRREISLKDIKNDYYSFEKYLLLCCSKLYKTSIIRENGIKFNEEMSYSEDLDFNLKYAKHCNNIVISDKVVYNYYTNHSSSQIKEDYPAQRIEMVLSFFGDEIDENIYNQTVKKYLRGCVNRYTSWFPVEKAAEKIKTAFEECNKFINKDTLEYSFTKNQSELILNNNYSEFVKEYIKGKNIPIERIRYKISSFIAKRVIK